MKKKIILFLVSLILGILVCCSAAGAESRIVLPEDLTRIESGAFQNTAAKVVVFPLGVSYIADDAFDSTSFTAIGYAGSYAETWCKKHDIPFNATETPASQFDYELIDSDTHIQINGYKGSDQFVVVPSKINGKNVTVLNRTFEDNQKVLSVTIPGTVKTLKWVFCDSSVRSVSIPKSVTDISDSCFSGSALENIKILANVTSIPRSSFSGCVKLKKVTMPSTLTVVKACAFSHCESLTSLSLPDSVTSIEWGAFEYCTSLTSWHFPKSLEGVGETIFEGCSKLTKVTITSGAEIVPWGMFEGNTYIKTVVIPATVTEIRAKAFKGCTALVTANVPDSVQQIGYEAFYGCKKLSSFHYPLNLASAGDNILAGCTSLSGADIASGVTTVEPLFQGANGLKSITLPSSVTCIKSNAFRDCTALTSVNYPKNLEEMGENVFKGCTSLAKITVPSGVTELIDNAFRGDDCLKTVVLPDSGLTRIGYSAFDGCSSLTSVNIPDSVSSIGMYAFRDCAKLAGWHYPSSLQTASWSLIIGSSDIFKGCKALTTVTVPEGITKIPDHLFEGADYVTRFVFPSTLQSVGEYSFAGCKAVTSFGFGGTALKTIGEGSTGQTFRDCTALTTVYLPDSVEYICCGAFNGCSSLTTWNYPKNLRSVGNTSISGMFENCTKLLKITIPEGVEEIPQYCFNCSGCLKNVTLPSTLTVLNTGAFANCGNLQVINTQYIRYFGDYCFLRCSSLTSVTIASGENIYIGTGAFDECPAYNP